MRISDWSSDVCSSDLVGPAVGVPASARERRIAYGMASRLIGALHFQTVCAELVEAPFFLFDARKEERPRSEEHTSELQSLMRISYAVFCLKKQREYTPLQPHTARNKNYKTKPTTKRYKKKTSDMQSIIIRS